jgi:hypothetical protein
LLELQLLERDVETVPDLGALKMLFYRLETVSQQAPDHPDVQNGVAQVKQKILARGLELKQAGAMTSTPFPGLGTPGPPPSTPYPPSPMTPTQQYSAPPLTPMPDAYPTMGLPAQQQPPPPVHTPFPGLDYGAPPAPVGPPAPPPAGGAMWKRALMIGGAVGLVAFGGLVYSLRKTKLGLPGATSAAVAVEFRTTPPGAQIRVNNEARCKSDCKAELAPGSYQVQAILEGFEPAAAALNVAAGAPASLNLPLRPLPLQVKLFVDLETGRVLLDDQPAGEIQQGQALLEKVQPGKHTVKVSGKDGEAAFGFEVIPGQAPVVAAPITVKNFLAVLVSGAGSAVRLHTSVVPMKVALDGQPAGEVAAEGLPLQNLTVGDHELALGEGKDLRKLVVGFTPAPMLTAFLKLDLNAGTLVVSAGEDDALIYLNGRTSPGLKTRRGQLRIPRLAVREYAVRVAKEGYQDVADQKVQIRKGEETRVEFKMVAAPKLAGLRLRGAVPGAQVLVDGNALGLVYSDGTFQNANIAPGERAIELRRERYTPKQVRKTFRAGETLDLAGAEFAMEVLPGILRLNITPAGARVTIKRSDEAQPRPVTDPTLRLPEGTYTITASAPNHQENVVTVQLVAGETKTIPLALIPLKTAGATPVKPAATATGMADWDEPGGWVQDGPWLVHKGGNFVSFKIQPLQGVLEFKVARLRGSRLRWFVNLRDQRNYSLFEMDRRRFYRRDVVNGRTIDLARVDHRVESENEYTMQIEIAPTAVVHRLQQGGAWSVLDAWNEAGRNFTAGRFGFRIDGSDQVGLANFAFRPR